MFRDVTVIGAGRAGSAIAARLRERGVAVRADGELRLLCVPDRAIAEVAQAIEPGPWVAHVSGGTPLAALDPHIRRFSVHPLQTLVRSRGPEQLDGAWGAVTAETPRPATRALWLAETLGLRAVRARRRPGPRALPRRRGDRLELPRHALPRRRRAVRGARALRRRRSCPLIERTIENGFELTGPIARGDWETVERHREALRGSGFEPAVRRARGGDQRMKVVRHDRRARPAAPRRGRSRADDGRAARGARRALPRRATANATCSSRAVFVNPAQFSERRRPRRVPARPRGRPAARPRPRASTSSSPPSADRDLPAGLRDVGRARRRGGRARGGRTAPATSAASRPSA